MSKEAVGQMNAKIGSSEYWSRVNHNTMLGGLMGAKTNYQATLRELGQRASGVIEEIYGDLSSLGSRIRFLDSHNRNALAKQVEGLYDVCKMTGVTVWHNSECVQGLNLSMMSPWTRNFRDERGIERAIAIINKSRFSGSEAVDLLKDAAKWSIDSAAGRDSKKREFLESVAQGSISSRFLEDVAEEYQNQSSRQSYEGKCGYTVGSRAYMEYMETQVFGTVVSGFGNPDYERFLGNALQSVADQLERDLDNAIRENDYITDQTAESLKAVVGELDDFGIGTGSLNGKIEKLAWFEGGDPTKIKELQKALNDLGVGQRLKEDGVYGEKTKAAISLVIDKTPERLKDPDKLQLLYEIDSSGYAPNLRKSIQNAWKVFWNTIWRSGIACILRPQHWDVAALLLEHSLEDSPSNLYFHQTHWVTQRIMESNGFQREFSKLKQRIQKDPEICAVDGSVNINFQETGDTDLYYGIGKCALKYTCTRYPTFVQIDFTMDDTYNFDEIRTISRDGEQFVVNIRFGNMANDLGLLSQSTKVISVYRIIVSFEKTIELN